MTQPKLPGTDEEKAEFIRTHSAPNLKRIEKMHSLYGKLDGERCGDCAHLVGKSYANTYYKCKIYGDSGGPATDWRLRWVACGKFERRAL